MLYLSNKKKMNPKIKRQGEIVEIVKNLKEQGKKVVTYNGSFDILHLGHIKSLEEAKAQGDILAILLNSDNSVQKYKGPNHPVNSEKERAEVLSAIGHVDYVVHFDEINPKEILKKIKPDIHCNGSDWGKNCVERGVVEENGGKIHILKWQQGFSTSGLMSRVAESRQAGQKTNNIHFKPEVKAVFLDRDGTININEPEYIHKIDDFKFVLGAISALKKLSKTDHKIIIATNQSGIARGYYNEKDLKKLHDWMLKELRKNEVRIDKIYYCPHGPNDNCPCRKPKPGMLLKAGEDFGLNLSKSWIVGDDFRDIIAGREANIKTIKIGKKMPVDLKLEPNYHVKNILDAVNIILNNGK
ncbi:MAG: histidinol phosphatase-like protein [Parcubacteria group bacterium GW2011_GWA2_37_10]|nr:MAG: histidinol phosphatase-like protein [Parcubacteria group bacterium GW2011_GWA2_37_10]